MRYLEYNNARAGKKKRHVSFRKVSTGKQREMQVRIVCATVIRMCNSEKGIHAVNQFYCYISPTFYFSSLCLASENFIYNAL